MTHSDRKYIGIFVAAVVVFVAATALGHPLWGLLAGSVPVVFGAAPIADSDAVRALTSWGVLDACGGMRKLRIVAKAADYTVVSPLTSAGDASGTLFTTRGAGAPVTFTLPAVTLAMAGLFYDFVGVADQTFTVAATATQVVTFNNAAATSLACSTGGAKIGAHIRALCDGTSWILIGDRVSVTYTVA